MPATDPESVLTESGRRGERDGPRESSEGEENEASRFIEMLLGSLINITSLAARIPQEVGISPLGWDCLGIRKCSASAIGESNQV